MMNDSLERLLKEKAVGKVIAWKNTESGNSETLRLTRVYSQKGYPCRTVNHSIKLKRERDPRQYIINYCNVGGSWKIAP